jgi:hypothetical protein
VPGNAADVAELWVLTEQAVDQLDALVRDADERLMSRLSFAVARENGETVIVLKTRPSKLPPPVLSLAKAHGFKPFWKLPNLFVPVGKRLMPTLRRDAVRKLLADDPAQVVWLMPGPDGKFTPEVLPDDTFRPLEDWIDYVIDHEHEPLQAWVQATHFDFDSFICTEDQPDRPKPPPSEKGKRPRKGEEPREDAELSPLPKGEKKKPPPAAESDFLVQAEAAPPNELKLKRTELEERFKAIDGPLDAPERLALWSQLAKLNAAVKDKSEAAICWTNAFWELPEVTPEGAYAWLRSEDAAARKVPTAEEFDEALTNRMPSPEAVRVLAVRALYACLLSPVPTSFRQRLPKVREYLERHEGILSVRTVWLSWWHLARVDADHMDVLGLARVRDRLLKRLLSEGLNKERDLPIFLRTGGEEGGSRMRVVRDRLQQVQRLVEQWHTGEQVQVNKPYVDLMFAFGYAKLGEVVTGRNLVNRAVAQLLDSWHKDPIQQRSHTVLAKAFAWRIENALQGKPHTGRLPPPILAAIAEIDVGRPKEGINPKYVVERLIEQSWILEPEEAVNPYESQSKSGPLQEISRLPTLSDPRSIRLLIDKEVSQKRSSADLLTVLLYASDYVQRAGEAYTMDFIARIPSEVFTADHDLLGTVDDHSRKTRTINTRMQRAKLLSRVIFLAAHYGNPDIVNRYLDHVYDLMKAKEGHERYEILSVFARRSIRELRRLGLRNQVDRLLHQIRDLVHMGRSVEKLKRESRETWPDVLVSLLCIAEGWQYFGAYSQARPYLDEARDTLVENTSAPKERRIPAAAVTKLVQAYISASAQGTLDDALDRIEELFRKLERLPNTYTTSSHFSRLHLNIVEEVIRSLVSDQIVLGDQARRWLDDDEYLVRRRIHADMRKLLAQSGL